MGGRESGRDGEEWMGQGRAQERTGRDGEGMGGLGKTEKEP